MEKNKQDAVQRRRPYDEAFNRDAVRLVAEEGYSFKSAATAVNVSEQSLRAWHAKFASPAPPLRFKSARKLVAILPALPAF